MEVGSPSTGCNRRLALKQAYPQRLTRKIGRERAVATTVEGGQVFGLSWAGFPFGVGRGGG